MLTILLTDVHNCLRWSSQLFQTVLTILSDGAHNALRQRPQLSQIAITNGFLCFRNLKGQCHQIFASGFFSWIIFPLAPENNIRII
jgi:hypothetical protein